MRLKERIYRDFTDNNRWISYRVMVDTSDLYIRSDNNQSKRAEEALNKARSVILEHVADSERFLTAMEPIGDPGVRASIVEKMYRASATAGVGPMAAVAGVIAEYVGEALTPGSEEIIVENGGDIWLRVRKPVNISLYPGNVFFSGNLVMKIPEALTPCGICTSSGKLGHSFSYGRADGATVIAGDAALADALATGACNMVKTEDDIPDALDYAMDRGALGAAIVIGPSAGFRGAVELTQPYQE